MNPKRLHQLMIALPVTLAVTAGTVRIALDYQDGTGFHPFGTDRELNSNQVLFPNGGTPTGEKQDEEDPDSSLLEKDHHAKEQTRPEAKEQADELFENQNEHRSQLEDLGELDNAQLAVDDVTTAGDDDSAYQWTEDTDHADLVIHGDVTPDGTGDSDETTPNIPTFDNDDRDDDTTRPSTPQTPSNNGNGGGNGGGTPNNGGSQPTPAPDPTPEEPTPEEPTPTPTPTPTPEEPTLTPSSTAKDPEATKSDPSYSNGAGQIKTLPYTERVTPREDASASGDNPSVILQQTQNLDSSQLYFGQTVDTRTIFCALDSYVQGKDGNLYAWSVDALDRYVRIDGISLDGGQTWESEFPVTLPTDGGQIRIKASYRLSEQSDTWVERQISYDLRANRTLILSEPLLENHVTLDQSIILNTLANQYYDLDQRINLLRYQTDLLGAEGTRLNALFPGWTEDGKLVPWNYSTTAGRHILEPSEQVPLDNAFTVQIARQWMNEDLTELDGKTLCYLQTLTGFQSDSDVLTVPEYVQAVCFPADAGVSVDTITLPATVLAFQNITDGGLQVRKSYQVDADNPRYCATENGLLWNRAKTELLGVPSERTELTVPAGVTQVQLPSANQLTRLRLEADTLDALPELDYTRLQNCQVIVPEQIRTAFLETYGETLAAGGNTVLSAETPDQNYHIEQGAILNDAGMLCGVLNDGRTSLTLPVSATGITAGAFAGADGIRTLMLPESETDLQLEPGCFQGGALETIVCSTQVQLDAVQAELNANGPAGVQVHGLFTTPDGASYYSETLEDGSIQTTLLHASPDWTEFDGTLTAPSGEGIPVHILGDGAFSDCAALQWVTLPEAVPHIGYRAFYGCGALEGVLIGTKDEIYIGDQAFDNCNALRFIASNAMTAVMGNDYDPRLTDPNGMEYTGQLTLFYIPTGAEGYGDNASSFTEESGVTGYQLASIGGTSKMLYGLNEQGEPWLGLRSGAEVPDVVELPETTVELFVAAMADTVSPSGSYTVDWASLPQLEAVDMSAFLHAQLSGEQIFGENFQFLGTYAFADCPQLTGASFQGAMSTIGEMAFLNCTALTHADFAQAADYGSLYAGTFNGCSSLTDITLEEMFQLVIYSSVPYQFNMEWGLEEEAQNLRVHVDDSMVQDCIRNWRYLFAGYSGGWGDSPYLEMWSDIQFQNVDWENFEIPEDEVVDAEVKKALLISENRVRTMLGLELAEEPTDFYPYREDGGYLTLIGAPSSITEISLDTDSLALPNGWYLDYLGTGTFAKSPYLEQVVVPETLAGIQPNAFQGVESERLTLYMEGEYPPELMNPTPEAPFVFGMDESRLSIQVPEGCEETYLQAWTFPLAGYVDFDDLQNAVLTSWTEEDGELTEEHLQEKLAEIVLPAENRLRQMLGMETVAVPTVLGSASTDWEKPEVPEEPEVPAEPETPEIPEVPELPTEPETPEKPEVSEQPAEPETPETPDVPQEPEESEPAETPSEPKTPEVPAEPETPEEPDFPESPEEPEKLELPTEPEVPEEPEAPTEPSETPDEPIDEPSDQKPVQAGEEPQA